MNTIPPVSPTRFSGWKREALLSAALGLTTLAGGEALHHVPGVKKVIMNAPPQTKEEELTPLWRHDWRLLASGLFAGSLFGQRMSRKSDSQNGEE